MKSYCRNVIFKIYPYFPPQHHSILRNLLPTYFLMLIFLKLAEFSIYNRTLVGMYVYTFVSVDLEEYSYHKKTPLGLL